MEKIMDKIINFVKKNYVMVTIIASIIVIVIVGLIVVKVINDRNKAKYSYDNGSYYEYFDNQKYEFDANLTYENGILVNIDSKDYTIYGSNIIYNKNENNMIIPKDYEIVLYFTDGQINRLKKYSEINYVVNMNTINSNGKTIISSKYFLFDGIDTYFFPDDFILHVNGKEINVSSYSYLYVTSDEVTVYDYKNDTINKYKQDKNTAYVEIGDLIVNLNKQLYSYNGVSHLLTNDVSSLLVYE